MTTDEVLDHRRAKRRGVVDVLHAAVAGARIVVARRVVAVRERGEGVVFAQRHRVGGWRHAADGAGEQTAAAALAARNRPADGRGTLHRAGATTAAAAGSVVGEGQRGVDLGVVRKHLRPLHVDRAARAIDAVGPGAEPRCDVMSVAQEEVGGIDQDASVALGRDGEAVQDRFGEGVFDRSPLVGVLTVRAKVQVRLNQHHPRADAMERDDASLPGLTAVQPDVVRAEAGAEAGGVEQLRVELGDFHPQRSGLLVPVEGHEAIEFAESGGAVADGLNAAVRRRASGRLRGSTGGGPRLRRLRGDEGAENEAADGEGDGAMSAHGAGS